MSHPPLNLPLIRRARQEAREAGLAGADPVAKLLATLLAIAEALAVIIPMLQSLVGADRGRLVLVLSGAMLLTAAASGFVGYRFGRAELAADCGRRAFVTEAGIACVLWPVPPGRTAAR